MRTSLLLLALFALIALTSAADNLSSGAACGVGDTCSEGLTCTDGTCQASSGGGGTDALIETPDTPSPPETPSIPDAPSQPDTPSIPDEPSTPSPPEVPSPPETPSIPDSPETPSIPDAPETPSIPETPSTPSTPSVDDATEQIPDVPEPPSAPSVDDVTDQIPAVPEIPSIPTPSLPGFGGSSSDDSIVPPFAQKGEGDDCGNLDVCKQGLTCLANKCVAQDGSQTLLEGTGNACSATDCCRRGLNCNSATERCITAASQLTTITCTVVPTEGTAVTPEPTIDPSAIPERTAGNSAGVVAPSMMVIVLALLTVVGRF